MTLIYIFPIAPVAITVLILVFALVGEIVAFIPIIEVFVWILFAVYCVFMLICSFNTDVSGFIRKSISFLISAFTCLLIGIATYDFFRYLYASYGSGGFNGTFEFLMTIIFGGAAWLLELVGFSWAGTNLLSAENSNFIWRLLGSVAAMAGCMYLL